MKDNKEILNEAFFKKASYDEKLAKKLPQYAPIDSKKPVRGDLSPFADLSSYQVTDTDEVKKRLAGTYGVAFGNNNIKNMASKALKTFPILVSSDVLPETAIMLKKLVEEQYAEYANLLISNQVINLADYSTDEVNGNIAIQALDSISGTDYAKSRVANKAARTDSLEVGDIFTNVPLYNLLRENEFKIDTGDEITNALLEDAVIIPSEEEETFVEFFNQYADDIARLNEDFLNDPDPYAKRREEDVYPSNKDGRLPTAYDTSTYQRRYMDSDDFRYGYDRDYTAGSQAYWKDREEREKFKDSSVDTMRGFDGMDANGEEIYRKLSTGDIVLDPDRFDQAINRTVGEFLAMPENRNIRERFELATFLLQSRRIAGIEYYNYLTLRLGIPVSDKARKELIFRFQIKDIRDYGKDNAIADRDAGIEGVPTIIGGRYRRTFSSAYQLDRESINAIAQNRQRVNRLVNEISKYNVKKVLGQAAGITAGVAGTGAAISAIVYAAKAPKTPLLPNFWAKLWNFVSFGKTGLAGGLIGGAVISAILGCAIGGAFALAKLIKKMRQRREEKINAGISQQMQSTKIQGWERVEKLINQLIAQREEVRSGKFVDNTVNLYVSQAEIDAKQAAASLQDWDTKAKKEDDKINASIEKFNKDILLKDDDKDGIKSPKRVLVTNKSEIRKQVEAEVKEANEILNKETEKYRKLLREAYLTEEENDDKNETFKNFLTNIEDAEPTQEDIDLINSAIDEVNEELKADKDYQAQILTEKILAKTRLPMKTVYVEKDPEKDILLMPELGPRATYLFGSTEIERKENKDRRYNQPLIMTVKFRERFSDGKIGDNELTAVIGILGKIIRIPTEEMEYVLKESVNGKTLEGFFKAGNIGDTVEDMLSTSKVSKDLKNLQRSADIWHNLEKVTTLALANKITGKRNNNISNAHIIFSQREVDNVRVETGIDLTRDIKKAVAFMKRYSAFTLMIANDAGERVLILDDQDNISWDVLPYNAIIGKDQGDQLSAALNKMMRH